MLIVSVMSSSIMIIIIIIQNWFKILFSESSVKFNLITIMLLDVLCMLKKNKPRTRPHNAASANQKQESFSSQSQARWNRGGGARCVVYSIVALTVCIHEIERAELLSKQWKELCIRLSSRLWQNLWLVLYSCELMSYFYECLRLLYKSVTRIQFGVCARYVGCRMVE